MSRKTKRIVKHILRKVLRTTMILATMALSMVAVIAMYFSTRFIPVYVNGEYILANQLVRYAIYAVWFVIFFKSLYDLCHDDSNRKRRK